MLAWVGVTAYSRDHRKPAGHGTWGQGDQTVSDGVWGDNLYSALNLAGRSGSAQTSVTSWNNLSRTATCSS